MTDPSGQQRHGGLVVPQVARILPGPAGKLQQLAAAGALQQATPEALGLKDQYSLHKRSQTSFDDVAFQSPPWIQAKQFAEGLDGQLHTVKMAKELSPGKVPNMLVILGAIQPSGPGSAFCKVKDPTGSIGAAIHRSVLQLPQYQQGHMTPGTVLLLQQVSVFTPAPGTSYLAVTAGNISKVWRGDTANERIRHAQHQPTQAPHQQQQQGMPQPASGPGSQLGSNSQVHTAAGITQNRSLQQTQQLQQQVQGHNLLQQQHRRPPQQQDSPSVAGSNRSSLFPPPSPDVSSIFVKSRQPPNPPQAPLPQEQRGPQLQQQQAALQQQQPPGSSGLGPDNSMQPKFTQPSQQQPQQQPRLRFANQGLMPPPAPRIHMSSFRSQVHRQQQMQQQQQPPPSQLFDSLLDDLADLDDVAAPVPRAGGPAADLSAAAAAAVAAGARAMSRGSMSQPAGRLAASRQQQHQGGGLSQQQQQQAPDSQFVPGALLQQIAGSSTMPPPAHKPPPAHLSSTAATAGAGCSVRAKSQDGDDAVDDVVTAIFGSQMGPAALPHQRGPVPGRPAVASIFGSQLAAPVVSRTATGGAQDLHSRPLNAAFGQNISGTGQQIRAPGLVQQGTADAGHGRGHMTGASSASSAAASGQEAAVDYVEPQQKRFKESPAAPTGMAGWPLAQLNPNTRTLQQLQQKPQGPIQQQGPQQHQAVLGGWGVRQPVRPAVSGAVPQASAQPGRSGVGFRAAGAVSLLDDLVGDELDELGDL